MKPPRSIPLVLALPLLAAGCGDDETSTVTETVSGDQTATEATETSEQSESTESDATSSETLGPKYFQTPSRNIGCYISAHDARCDIRERSWSPPPEPAGCKKIGLGDTALGGPATLPYGSNARRGAIRCHSGQKGITCSNAENGHGFFLSRQSYRIF